MKQVEIYTDGACSGNPGPGGWGAVLIYEGKRKEISGYESKTTNNRMEILAVINALKCLKENCLVNLYTDSNYVYKAFEDNWIENWIKNGWKNSAKKPVSNKELWEELICLTKRHKVTFHKVKGHADNELNNRCDELATGEIDKNVNRK